MKRTRWDIILILGTVWGMILLAGSSGGLVPQKDSGEKPYCLEGLVKRLSHHHQINPDLIKAMIKVESNFDPRALSPKGAMGLMQLMPQTAERWGVSNPFDPADNIKGGIMHFRFLMEKFSGDLEKSLAAYNAGENIVARLDGIPPYRETIRYVKLVLGEFKNFQQIRTEKNRQHGNKQS